ncbi:basic helix-loop-helix protein 80-like [Curcuma longa]|uniref:basic helix-loop-helix protein 80-like n=1 Tax=Curcuma longa TaxID=136217 RepID=UPI003D9DC314
MASFPDTIVDSTGRQHYGDAANSFSDCFNYYFSLGARPQVAYFAATEAGASSDIKSSVSMQVDISGASQNGSSITAKPCKEEKESQSSEKLRSKRGVNGGAQKEKEAKRVKFEEPPKGVIHVRAKRGEATDSHSLAERVRREKISEKMKILQSLVPGCDKIKGKQLILEEIINYVQCLQNQIEILSMKLVSMSSLLTGIDLDNPMDQAEVMPATVPNDYQMMEQCLEPCLLTSEHGPTLLPSQDGISLLMQVLNQTQGSPNHEEFNNLIN